MSKRGDRRFSGIRVSGRTLKNDFSVPVIAFTHIPRLSISVLGSEYNKTKTIDISVRV